MGDSMSTVFSGSLKGVVRTDLCTLGRRLGGLYFSHKATIVFNIPVQPEGGIHRCLVEIAAVTKRPEMTRWRIWVDGVPVTREYRPNHTLWLGDREVSTSIFDVTPIIRRDPRRTRHKLTIINEGSEPLLLLYSMMLKAMEMSEALTEVMYMSGGLELKPGETKEFTLPSLDESSLTVVRIPIYALCTPSLVTVKMPGAVKEFSINSIADEIRLSMPSVGTIALTNNNACGSECPLIAPSLVSYTERRRRPVLTVKTEEANESKDGMNVKVKILNTGDRHAENVQVILLCLGEPVARKMIEKIEAGDEVEVELKARLPGKARVAVARVVWRDLDETMLAEDRIRLPNRE